MTQPTVQTVDDREPRALEFVIQAAREHAADDDGGQGRGRPLFGRPRHAPGLERGGQAPGHFRVPRHGPQPRSQVGLKAPSARSLRRRQSEPLQGAQTLRQRTDEIALRRSALAPQVDTALWVRVTLEHPVQSRPSFGPDVPHQGGRPLAPSGRAELQFRQGLGARPDAPADVVPVDHQIRAVLQPSAQDDVDVGVGGVPVIDRDPVEPGPQVRLDAGHEVPRIGAQIRQLARVLGRDDEAEMVAVITRALREDGPVRPVGPGVEQPSRFAVPRHPVPLKITDVGAEPARAASNDPGLDHDLPSRAAGLQSADDGCAATAEGGDTRASRRPPCARGSAGPGDGDPHLAQRRAQVRA